MANVATKRWSDHLFLALLVTALLLLGRIVLPLIMPVLLGTFCVVLLLPMHQFLARQLPGRARAAAGLSTAAVLLLFVVPLGLATYAMAREGMALMRYARSAWSGLATPQLLAALPEGLQRWVTSGTPGDWVGSTVPSLLPQAMSTGAGVVLGLFIMTVTVYYFFLDGHRLFREVVRLLPLDARYPQAFAHEFRDVAHALVYGNALTGLLQGAVGWVGLWLAGVPRPHVWGLGMVFASFVPLGGTALLWGPLGLMLICTGKLQQGLFLITWGALVVSTIDNVARPILCGSRLAVHPLLVSLSIFGGLSVFGVMGLLIGPLIAALVMAMVRIYRRDFLGIEDAPRAIPAPVAVTSLAVSMDAATPPK